MHFLMRLGRGLRPGLLKLDMEGLIFALPQEILTKIVEVSFSVTN